MTSSARKCSGGNLSSPVQSSRRTYPRLREQGAHSGRAPDGDLRVRGSALAVPHVRERSEMFHFHDEVLQDVHGDLCGHLRSALYGRGG